MCFVQCNSKNCGLANCSNQPFKKFPGEKSFKVATAGKKGVGLIATRRIPKGSFIVEYVGEVRNFQVLTNFQVMTVEQWIDRQREDGNEKKHFYVMELTADHMADASRKVRRNFQVFQISRAMRVD